MTTEHNKMSWVTSLINWEGRSLTFQGPFLPSSGDDVIPW